MVLSTNSYGAGTYLPADGRLLEISEYTAVFSIMGINFGGNGTSNFALPDLRHLAPPGLYWSVCVEGIFPSRP
jgi:microcystin-dependent protein